VVILLLKLKLNKVKHKVLLRKISFLLSFLLISHLVYSQQTGKIAGKVTDTKTGETLIGLTVRIAGSTSGASTDVEGRYTLGNLTPGKYSLTFSYIGYQSKNITEIEVMAGQSTILDVTIEEASSQALQEVVVTATLRQESVNALYAQQKNSISISSGISSEQIRRSSDRNTSEVLKRVSGTSIQDNKFVVVRGLSDRYNSARLNNAALPSSEPDRKAFSFDIIPSNLIDNVIINKTASPDLPGDFTGGLVTINTKDFPEENFLNFSTGVGYNSESTFKDFKSGRKGGLDILGFDNGNRQIPNGFAGRSRFNTLPLSQKLAQTKLLSNSFNINAGKSSPVQNYQLTWGAVKEFKNSSTFGSIISLSYRNSESINNSHRLDYETDGHAAYDFRDDIYKYSTNVGLLANFSYKKNRSRLSFRNIINKSFDDVYTSRNGINTDNAVARKSNTIDLTDKALINSQIDGEHAIGKNDWKLNWNANYTFTYRDQPDLRVQSYAKPLDAANDPSVPFRAEMPSGSSASRPLSRFFSRLDDYAYGASVSLAVPFNFNKETSSFKIGASALLKDRTFNARVLGYVGASSQFDNSLRNLSPDLIFSPENINENGFVLNEITNNNDKYQALADLYAGYLMMDNRLNNKVRLSWGARVEYYNQDLDSRGFSNEKINADVSNLDVLPSFNLTYNVTDKSNFRFSGSKTVARPELRELAPFQYYDFISNSTTSGNASLIRTDIYNGDIKFEYYPKSGELLSGGIFYKRFDNPIEQVIPAGSNANNRLRTYANANSASNYGFEIEMRKRLNFIDDSSEWLKSLIFFANYSYIVSDVDLSNTTTAASERKRALQGQSPYLINAGLQYNNARGDFGLSLMYNRIGQRISDVGFEGYPSIYENSRDLIDAQVSKKVLKSRAEIKLNLSDMLNQNIVFYQNQNGKKTYESNIDNHLNTYKPGTSVSLSFSYNLSSRVK